jgi:hypothetical protein
MVSPGDDCGGDDDPLAFKALWSRFRINLWLGDVLPKPITWLRENPKIANDHTSDDDSSDSEYQWVLLRERNKLVKFKKKGGINGKDLQTVRGP